MKGTTVTKYYFAGATRLAVRTGGTLSFLLSDHLGRRWVELVETSSVTTDASGVKTATALYKAFGESRFSSGNLGTDYGFTGQRLQAELGIYWFQSRWMDPSLGRFTQPDSIVPTGSQGTQAWDRYAFVNNNPVRYNDPTGHNVVSGDGTTCYEEVENCSVTHSVLVSSYGWYLAPSAGGSESTCAGCSADGPQDRKATSADAWGAAAEAANSVTYVSQGSQKTDDIFVFLTYDSYADGTTSVTSVDVINKTNIDLSVPGVIITATNTNACEINPCSYSIDRPTVYSSDSTDPGIGVVPPHSATSISLIPSGYAPNPTNAWGSNYSLNVQILLTRYITGQIYGWSNYTVP